MIVTAQNTTVNSGAVLTVPVVASDLKGPEIHSIASLETESSSSGSSSVRANGDLLVSTTSSIGGAEIKCSCLTNELYSYGDMISITSGQISLSTSSYLPRRFELEVLVDMQPVAVLVSRSDGTYTIGGTTYTGQVSKINVLTVTRDGVYFRFNDGSSVSVPKSLNTLGSVRVRFTSAMTSVPNVKTDLTISNFRVTIEDRYVTFLLMDAKNVTVSQSSSVTLGAATPVMGGEHKVVAFNAGEYAETTVNITVASGSSSGNAFFSYGKPVPFKSGTFFSKRGNVLSVDNETNFRVGYIINSAFTITRVIDNFRCEVSGVASDARGDVISINPTNTDTTNKSITAFEKFSSSDGRKISRVLNSGQWFLYDYAYEISFELYVNIKSDGTAGIFNANDGMSSNLDSVEGLFISGTNISADVARSCVISTNSFTTKRAEFCRVSTGISANVVDAYFCSQGITASGIISNCGAKSTLANDVYFPGSDMFGTVFSNAKYKGYDQRKIEGASQNDYLLSSKLSTARSKFSRVKNSEESSINVNLESVWAENVKVSDSTVVIADFDIAKGEFKNCSITLKGSSFVSGVLFENCSIIVDGISNISRCTFVGSSVSGGIAKISASIVYKCEDFSSNMSSDSELYNNLLCQSGSFLSNNYEDNIYDTIEMNVDNPPVKYILKYGYIDEVTSLKKVFSVGGGVDWSKVGTDVEIVDSVATFSNDMFSCVSGDTLELFTGAKFTLYEIIDSKRWYVYPFGDHMSKAADTALTRIRSVKRRYLSIYESASENTGQAILTWTNDYTGIEGTDISIKGIEYNGVDSYREDSYLGAPSIFGSVSTGGSLASLIIESDVDAGFISRCTVTGRSSAGYAEWSILKDVENITLCVNCTTNKPVAGSIRSLVYSEDFFNSDWSPKPSFTSGVSNGAILLKNKNYSFAVSTDLQVSSIINKGNGRASIIIPNPLIGGKIVGTDCHIVKHVGGDLYDITGSITSGTYNITGYGSMRDVIEIIGETEGLSITISGGVTNSALPGVNYYKTHFTEGVVIHDGVTLDCCTIDGDVDGEGFVRASTVTGRTGPSITVGGSMVNFGAAGVILGPSFGCEYQMGQEISTPYPTWYLSKDRNGNDYVGMPMKCGEPSQSYLPGTGMTTFSGGGRYRVVGRTFSSAVVVENCKVSFINCKFTNAPVSNAVTIKTGGDVDFVNCVVYNAEIHGIEISGGKADIVNCNIIACSAGVIARAGAIVRVINTICSNNDYVDFAGSFEVIQNCISSDASVKKPNSVNCIGNYQPGTSGVYRVEDINVINKGKPFPGITEYFNTDINGIPRGRWDVGAFSYASSFGRSIGKYNTIKALINASVDNEMKSVVIYRYTEDQMANVYSVSYSNDADMQEDINGKYAMYDITFIVEAGTSTSILINDSVTRYMNSFRFTTEESSMISKGTQGYVTINSWTLCKMMELDHIKCTIVNQTSPMKVSNCILIDSVVDRGSFINNTIIHPTYFTNGCHEFLNNIIVTKYAEGGDLNYDSSNTIWGPSVTTPPHMIFEDPMLDSDYKISDDSPCVNTGVYIREGSSYDAYGRRRVVSGTIDRGAYETSVVVLKMTSDDLLYVYSSLITNRIGDDNISYSADVPSDSEWEYDTKTVAVVRKKENLIEFIDDREYRKVTSYRAYYDASVDRMVIEQRNDALTKHIFSDIASGEYVFKYLSKGNTLEVYKNPALGIVGSKNAANTVRYGGKAVVQ